MKKTKLKRLVRNCNNVLVHKYRKCGCSNKKGLPSNNIKKCIAHSKKRKGCSDYALCMKFMKRLMSGSEPALEPEPWNKNEINDSHNCYAYFLNDRNIITRNRCRKICKKNRSCKKKTQECSQLKPQPSYWAVLRGTRKRRNKKYDCRSMVKGIQDDNRNIKRVKFTEKCPKNFYKGVLVVDTKNPTYHFLRNDNNIYWSHKPGTTPVTNKDASGRLIVVPHLADMNYAKKNKGSLNYDKTCAYMCLPKNNYIKTYAI